VLTDAVLAGALATNPVRDSACGGSGKQTRARRVRRRSASSRRALLRAVGELEVCQQDDLSARIGADRLGHARRGAHRGG